MKLGDYADYIWPTIHGDKSVRVKILEVYPATGCCLVRLAQAFHSPGEKSVRAGRLHICKNDSLRVMRFRNIR